MIDNFSDIENAIMTPRTTTVLDCKIALIGKPIA